MKTKLGLLATSALAALSLVGCGDETTNVTGLQTVANLQEAGRCAAGDMVLNLEDAQVYVCSPDNKWGVLKGDKGDKGDTGANGTPGAQGKQGIPGVKGEDGSSCTARIVDDGVEVSCGGTVLDTLKNGTVGVGCTSEALKDDQGVARAVVVTCGAQVDTLVSAGYTVGYCNGHMFNATNLFCDERDSTLYKWVTIGTQTWMAENLNYVYKKGDSVYGNWCYGDSTKYCAQYGRLYSWDVAMDSVTTGCGHGKTCAASSGRVRGVCPDGWHLPSTAEWDTLFIAVGGQSTAGTKLKSPSGWSNNGNGTDAYGFSASPSGGRKYDEDYSYAGDNAYFWSSSENGQDKAYLMYLDYAHANAALNSSSKRDGYAVRCLRD